MNPTDIYILAAQWGDARVELIKSVWRDGCDNLTDPVAVKVIMRTAKADHALRVALGLPSNDPEEKPSGPQESWIGNEVKAKEIRPC